MDSDAPPAPSGSAPDPTPPGDVLARFVGRSRLIRNVLADIGKVAGTGCAILIEGESGTGKELTARVIHGLSGHRDGPFEAVNCGAIPEALVESELFGHMAGSFTGAIRNHRGAFERAGSGTVFLDEIADLPLAAQVKLLRVLQEQCFRPVGSEKLLPARARVVAASNKDLRHEVRAGRFRQDLYYRLNVFPIRLPPLRERREDLPMLIGEFLRTLSRELECPEPDIEPAAVQRLTVYSYPGNVRELQNLIRTLIIEARDTGDILDRHVVALFRRHRIEDYSPGAGGEEEDDAEAAGGEETTGEWVLEQLRKFDFNIALAERKLRPAKYSLGRTRGNVACSRSGLTYYLQGEWLRVLPEVGWDQEAAAQRLAGHPDLADRLRGKLDHFLHRALTAVRGAHSAAARRTALGTAFAKLPATYEGDLDRFAAEFPSARWKS